MKYYYYSYEHLTLTHEDWPKGHWQHDSCIGTNFKEIKELALEDLQQRLQETKGAIKAIKSLTANTTEETRK